MIQPLWGTVWRFLKKLKIELPYDPAIPLLGIYPEKTIKGNETELFVVRWMDLESVIQSKVNQKEKNTRC